MTHLPGRHVTLALLLAAAFLFVPQRATTQEGPTTTQALIAIDSKVPVTPTPATISIKVDNRLTPIASLNRVVPSGAQVAILIDDGLRQSISREIPTLESFVQSLPPGTEIFIGYMQNGRVVAAQPFTTEYASAARAFRSPLGASGISASPYFCLSDFVKKWPSSPSDDASLPAPKARFVLMITSGVDPYNGSVSILNQNSPYVAAAATDAQRAGVPVYSIYYGAAGIRGGAASFSGQSYLQQVAQATGGRAYYLGTGNPVSLAPFLSQFKKAMAETYVATFDTPSSKDLIRFKASTKLPGTKVRSADQIRSGARIDAK
jgi:hypothetical protein